MHMYCIVCIQYGMIIVEILGCLFRKDTHSMFGLGNVETKLLYTLHWIILDAAEECQDADAERGIPRISPFQYLFSVSCVQVRNLILFFL